jgi:AcrR family transcriptional regulator
MPFLYELLHERSVRVLTMEAVASSAGVGKPTLYKWWPTKAAFVLAMFRERIAVALAGFAKQDILRGFFAPSPRNMKIGRLATHALQLLSRVREIASVFNVHPATILSTRRYVLKLTWSADRSSICPLHLTCEHA